MRKKITIIGILILLCLITLVGCGKKNYDVNDEVVYQVNGTEITVTKSDLYHTLLQNYGLSTTLNALDKEIFKNELNSQGQSYWDLALANIDDNLNKTIYNTTDLSSLTEEEKATLKEEFDNKMLLYFGFNEDQAKEYYTVSLARTLYERDFYLAENEKTDFTESEYQSEYDSLYPASYQAIILDYSSLDQCYSALAQEHIEIKDNVWVNTQTGVALTNKEVCQAFIRLYNTINQDKGTDYMYQEGRDYTATEEKIDFSTDSTIGIYTPSDLKSITSSLSNYIKTSLSPYSYTLSPKTYSNGTITLLIYYIGEVREDFNDVKQACYENLMSTALTTTYQLKALATLRNKYHFYLNDSYLNAEYQEYLDEVELKYADTKKQNNYIAQSDVLNMTAEELYAAMDNYSILEIIDKIIYNWEFNDSSINTIYYNGQVLDPTQYTECKNEVSEMKENFNNNEFEDNGYPKSFGWKNYIKEIYNVDSEEALILYFVGLKVEENYNETFYDFKSHSSVYMNYINQAYDNYFDVDFTDVALVLYDAKGNLINYSDWTLEQKEAGLEFAQAIKGVLETSTDKLSVLYNEYRRAKRYVFHQGIPCSGEDCESTYMGINLTKYLTMGFILGKSSQENYTGGGYAEIDQVAKAYWTAGSQSGISDVLTCTNGLHIYIQEASNDTDFYNNMDGLMTEANVGTYISELDSTDDSSLNSQLVSFLDEKFEAFYEEYASSSYTTYCVYQEMYNQGWFTNQYTTNIESLKILKAYVEVRLSNYKDSFEYITLE